MIIKNNPENLKFSDFSKYIRRSKKSNKMGSYARAIMTGFICRLCSEQKKKVIHLYSGKAKKLALMKKIKLLPITIDKYDNLPKTVCEQCIERLEIQYNLVLKIKKSNAIQRSHRMFHSNGRCPVECPLHGIHDPNWAGLDSDEL